MAAADLTAARARELYRYDPESGLLYRRHASGEKTGKARSNGYLVVLADGRQYSVHRLIWLIVHGAWPVGVIDHINSIKTDNRLCNLRDVSHAENMHNQRGARGYYFNKVDGTYNVTIGVDGKAVYVGAYKTAAAARAAYLAAKTTHHPTAPFFDTGPIVGQLV